MNHYDEGFRAGHLDHYIGLDPYIVSLTSTLPGYSQGYKDGYYNRPAEVITPGGSYVRSRSH